MIIYIPDAEVTFLLRGEILPSESSESRGRHVEEEGNTVNCVPVTDGCTKAMVGDKICLSVLGVATLSFLLLNCIDVFSILFQLCFNLRCLFQKEVSFNLYRNMIRFLAHNSRHVL